MAKIWLYRMAKCRQRYYKLLGKGYLAMGYAEFAKQGDFISAMRDSAVLNGTQKTLVEEKILSRWEELHRNHCLWQFLKELQAGDKVLLPLLSRRFACYEVTGQWKTLEEGKEKQSDEVGFLLPVRSVLSGEKDRYGIVSFPIQEYTTEILATALELPFLLEQRNELVSPLEKTIALTKQPQKTSPLRDLLWQEIKEQWTRETLEKTVLRYLEREGALCFPQEEERCLLAKFPLLQEFLFVMICKEENLTEEVLEQVIQQQKRWQVLPKEQYGYRCWIVADCVTYPQNWEEKALEWGICLLNGKEIADLFLQAGIQRFL